MSRYLILDSDKTFDDEAVILRDFLRNWRQLKTAVEELRKKLLERKTTEQSYNLGVFTDPYVFSWSFLKHLEKLVTFDGEEMRYTS